MGLLKCLPIAVIGASADKPVPLSRFNVPACEVGEDRPEGAIEVSCTGRKVKGASNSPATFVRLEPTNGAALPSEASWILCFLRANALGEGSTGEVTDSGGLLSTIGPKCSPVADGVALWTEAIDSRRSLSLGNGVTLCSEIVDPSPESNFLRKSSGSFLSDGSIRGLESALGVHLGWSVMVERRELSGRRGMTVGPPMKNVCRTAPSF